MKILDPSMMENRVFYQWVTSSVMPRPIALVSTLDEHGNPNLAPFSFFNYFGLNPHCLAFSPVRRGRDGSLKDTCINLMNTKECVVHIVSEEIVDQVNITATEFSSGINEFVKSGLTPIPSVKVKPFRVKESKVHFECKLLQHIPIGQSNGSANLLVCEILLMHINENICGEKGVYPQELKAVGRCGFDDYAKAFGDSIFTLPRPVTKAIGFENIPTSIKESDQLTAKELSRLAACEMDLPNSNDVLTYWGADHLPAKMKKIKLSSANYQEELRKMITEGFKPQDDDLTWLKKIITEDVCCAWYAILAFYANG